ncbi:phosphonate ABC transporter ATP-binding protein [Sphingomonas sp. HMWF008]|nr:phosphonate ABC transporter ATP-binding protein [Sphingomonas sp. HMWF008]
MLIELTKIERRYTSGEVETAALREIDLAIDEGEFVAIMGPSGCGKSTLLNVLGTLDRPSSGTYHFNGIALTGLSDNKLTALRRQHIGFIFQSFNLIDELTIRENVELGLVYRGTPERARRAAIDEAMDKVGIVHRARHYPHQLSGGQQQRAAIARAIVGAPELVLADEPTGNLDSENGEQVLELLMQLNRSGTTIVMVTHSPRHADLAKRVINMLDGRVLICATRERS